VTIHLSVFTMLELFQLRDWIVAEVITIIIIYF